MHHSEAPEMLRDLDDLAERYLRQVGLAPDLPPCPLALAERLMGPGSVRVAPASTLLLGDAALVVIDSAPVVLMRPGVRGEAARWALFHELGHVIADRETLRNTERMADILAAMLRIPRSAASRTIERYGSHWPSLAAAWRTSETSAVLRFGEVTWQPTALVSPRSVRLRGSVWPVHANALRKAARRVGQRLSDDRQRWALVG